MPEFGYDEVLGEMHVIVFEIVPSYECEISHVPRSRYIAFSSSNFLNLQHG